MELLVAATLLLRAPETFSGVLVLTANHSHNPRRYEVLYEELEIEGEKCGF